MNLPQLIKDLDLLAARLERLSADSIYAHRASGYRGNILRYLERLSDQDDQISQVEIDNALQLTEQAFNILTAAAREIVRS